MTREEVIEVLTNALDGLGTAWVVDEAISAAIKLLASDINVARSLWVKTADRLPTKADADRKLNVFVWTHSGGHVVNYQRVIESPDFYPWWMPIPPLPEVEK